jgi:hypothetical protein
MQTILEPVGNKLTWYSGSATTEIISSNSGLRVVISSAVGTKLNVEIHFPYAKAFQVLDDGDMLEYWDKHRPLKQHVVYRVLSGGWLDRSRGHYFHVTSANEDMYEWLIVSDAGPCVTVISTYRPHIREYE